MHVEELFAMVFVVGMFAGVFIIYLGLRQRSAQLEMQHRERMAMIERGQVPLSDMHESHRRPRATTGSRSMSVGIIVVGLGFAMMTLISIAGDNPEVGIGVGGAVAILGAAFIVRTLLSPSAPAIAPPPPPLPPDERG
jgi:hypothetical protein